MSIGHDPLYIVADSIEDAQRTARRNKIDPKGWLYVHNFSTIAGVKGRRILFALSWIAHPDAGKIMAHAKGNQFKVYMTHVEEPRARENMERKLQIAAVNWIKMALPELLVIAIPNEQGYHAKTEEEKTQQMIRMELLKKMGLLPGAADLFLFGATEQLGIMRVWALETKWGPNGQSPKQVVFEDMWTRKNGIYAVYRTLPELAALFKRWGLRPLCPPPANFEDSREKIRNNLLVEFQRPTAPPEAPSSH